jgi:hypothetical protein
MNDECPSCGAEIPAGSLRCRYCEFEVRSEAAQTFQCIQELQAKLTEADNSMSAKDKVLYGEMQLWRKKASIIQGLALPTTKADLIYLVSVLKHGVLPAR